jgi:hypothetical protein
MPLVCMNYQTRHTRAAMYTSPGFHHCDSLFYEWCYSQAPTGTKLPWISLCCWKTHKGAAQGALSTAEPIKGSQIVCQILKEFCSLLPDIQKRLLCCRTLEGQGFFVEPKWPLPTPKPLQQHRFICQNVATVYFSLIWLIWFRNSQLHLSLALESTVGWISTLAYGINTNSWPKRFSVVYCTHIVQTKLMLKNQCL